jgi:hypothetical protein
LNKIVENSENVTKRNLRKKKTDRVVKVVRRCILVGKFPVSEFAVKSLGFHQWGKDEGRRRNFLRKRKWRKGGGRGKEAKGRKEEGGRRKKEEGEGGRRTKEGGRTKKEGGRRKEEGGRRGDIQDIQLRQGFNLRGDASSANSHGGRELDSGDEAGGARDSGPRANPGSRDIGGTRAPGIAGG